MVGDSFNPPKKTLSHLEAGRIKFESAHVAVGGGPRGVFETGKDWGKRPGTSCCSDGFQVVLGGSSERDVMDHSYCFYQLDLMIKRNTYTQTTVICGIAFGDILYRNKHISFKHGQILPIYNYIHI